MRSLHMRFTADESGTTALEYALICGFISIVILGVVTTLGANVHSRYSDIATQIDK